MQNYDASFTLIQDRFLNGQIAENGLQDQKTRALINLACLTAIQTFSELLRVLMDIIDNLFLL